MLTKVTNDKVHKWYGTHTHRHIEIMFSFRMHFLHFMITHESECVKSTQTHMNLSNRTFGCMRLCVCVKCHQVAYRHKHWPIPIILVFCFFSSIFLFYLLQIFFSHEDRSTNDDVFVFFHFIYVFFFSFIDFPTSIPFNRVYAMCMC